MTTRPFTVLFLCTGNSARSLLAEALLRDRGGSRFRSFSAGSHPQGRPHPDALHLLESRGHETSGLRSKSWDEFAGAEAPHLDLVITVCDNAAGETCPVWPGAPVRVHWGLPDPASVEPREERLRVFAEVYAELDRRIAALTGLPPEALGGEAMRERLQRL